MKEIRFTSQFKKDFKHIKNDARKVEVFYQIADKLRKGEPIPPQYKPHQLSGDWKNHMECHLNDDYLLIWYDKIADVIEFVRLGSHSELFGKGRKR